MTPKNMVILNNHNTKLKSLNATKTEHFLNNLKLQTLFFLKFPFVKILQTYKVFGLVFLTQTWKKCLKQTTSYDKSQHIKWATKHKF